MRLARKAVCRRLDSVGQLRAPVCIDHGISSSPIAATVMSSAKSYSRLRFGLTHQGSARAYPYSLRVQRSPQPSVVTVKVLL